MKPVNLLLVLLNAYFILNCITIERNYCARELDPNDTRFLMKETYDYSKANNPLFLQRPEWLRMATCISAYGFSMGYLLIFWTALTDAWTAGGGSNCFLITMFIGAKIYALLYYHLSEFTHPELAPWDSLVGYWAAEGPYLLAIGLTIYKLLTAQGKKKKVD